jgi:hypothetical protein
MFINKRFILTSFQAEVVGRQMGVDIMGYVIDASGTASFAFGSGPRYERVKTQYKSVLQRSLKDQEHIFGYVGFIFLYFRDSTSDT